MPWEGAPGDGVDMAGVEGVEEERLMWLLLYLIVFSNTSNFGWKFRGGVRTRVRARSLAM